MIDPNRKLKKISLKWLTKKLNCTPEGQKICQGKCCTGEGIWGLYSDEEYKLLPKDIQEQLTKDEGGWRVPRVNNKCIFISYCIKRLYKPYICELFPLEINKHGVLVLHRWCAFHCPNYGKGEAIYISFKPYLIKTLGEELYNTIRKEIEKGNLNTLKVSQAKVVL